MDARNVTIDGMNEDIETTRFKAERETDTKEKAKQEAILEGLLNH